MDSLKKRKSSSGATGSQPSVDDILERLGTLGRYQLLQTSLICAASITAAFQLLNVVFITQDVQYQCGDPMTRNYSINGVGDDECKVAASNTSTNESATSACTSWVYSREKTHSLVSEWDLVCDKEVFSRLPQSMFVAGQAIGSISFSMLSDKYGRKSIFLLTHVFTAGFGVALAFSPNIETFTALRFISGAFQQGVVMTFSTMLLESYPKHLRLEVFTVSTLVWSGCLMLLTLVSFLLRDATWRTLQLVLSAMSCSVLLQIVFLDETLRWLIANKKTDRAQVVIKKASTINKVNDLSLSHVGRDINTLLDGDESREASPTAATHQSCLLIAKSRFLLKTAAIIAFVWMIDSLTYFSLFLTSSSLVDGLYLNFFLNSLADVPASPLLMLISRRIGRRKCLFIFHILAGICLLISTAIRNLTVNNTASVAVTIFAFLGKVSNAVCFSSMFIYVPEIYPTNVRTTGLGLGSAAARVGAAMAPFTSMLVVPWLPGTIFGVSCLIAAGLMMLLPEPEGRELPETVIEIKSWDNRVGDQNGKVVPNDTVR